MPNKLFEQQKEKARYKASPVRRPGQPPVAPTEFDTELGLLQALASKGYQDPTMPVLNNSNIGNRWSPPQVEDYPYGGAVPEDIQPLLGNPLAPETEQEALLSQYSDSNILEKALRNILGGGYGAINDYVTELPEVGNVKAMNEAMEGTEYGTSRDMATSMAGMLGGYAGVSKALVPLLRGAGLGTQTAANVAPIISGMSLAGTTESLPGSIPPSSVAPRKAPPPVSSIGGMANNRGTAGALPSTPSKALPPPVPSTERMANDMKRVFPPPPVPKSSNILENPQIIALKNMVEKRKSQLPRLVGNAEQANAPIQNASGTLPTKVSNYDNPLVREPKDVDYAALGQYLEAYHGIPAQLGGTTKSISAINKIRMLNRLTSLPPMEQEKALEFIKWNKPENKGWLKHVEENKKKK